MSGWTCASLTLATSHRSTSFTSPSIGLADLTRLLMLDESISKDNFALDRREVLGIADDAIVESGACGEQHVAVLHRHVRFVGAMHAQLADELRVANCNAAQPPSAFSRSGGLRSPLRSTDRIAGRLYGLVRQAIRVDVVAQHETGNRATLLACVTK